MYQSELSDVAQYIVDVSQCNVCKWVSQREADRALKK